MKNKQLALAVLLLSGLPAYAGGLKASVVECKEVKMASVLGTIATAVAKTLLGGLIDGAVNALSQDRVETFDVVVPVDDLTELLADGKNCLVVSSETQAKAGQSGGGSTKRFSAKFKFIKHKTSQPPVWRPVVVEWTYKDFLSDFCPWYLRCARRDVVFALEMFAPGVTPLSGIGASQPLGVVIENADSDAVQAALKADDSLPWFVASPESGPANLRFRMVETIEPYAFSKALGAALKAEKENILTTVDNKLKGISDQVAAEAAQKDVSAATTTFDAYKVAWQTANTTQVAYATAIEGDKKQLALTYALQYRAVVLAETLARAAFEIAKISWPDGGLGTLPSSL